MSLTERVYSILIVSAGETFHRNLASLLPEAKYSPVRLVAGTGQAKRALSQRVFDFVIINAPLPDGEEIRFAVDVSSDSNTVVLLAVRSELYEEINARVTPFGVFTLQKPTSRAVFLTALDWMASIRERLRRAEKKFVSIEEKMAEIRVVNRAKWLLIEKLKMDEPAAHRYIEKQAMDRCISKKKVAEEIIVSWA